MTELGSDNSRQRERQREYRRLKKIGGGDYFAGCRIEAEKRRSQMSPYDLGIEDAMTQKSAVEMYNTRPSLQQPFLSGTPEEEEYDRGWKDAMNKQSF